MVEKIVNWLLAQLAQHPEATMVLVCVAGGLFAHYKGLVTITLRRKAGQPAKPDSGRWKAVRILDDIQQEALEMPETWQVFVDLRAQHKTANLLQERVFPLIEREKSRIDRLDPAVTALMRDVREEHDRGIRLEEKLEGVKEDLTEVKAGVADINKTISENAKRTHQLLGTLLEKGRS